MNISSIDKFDLNTHQDIANFFPINFPDDHYPEEAEQFKAKYGNSANINEMYRQHKLWVTAHEDQSTQDLSGIMLIGERALGQVHIFWVIVAKQSRQEGVGSELVKEAVMSPVDFLIKTAAEDMTYPQRVVLTASIKEGNTASEKLFQKQNFTKVSVQEYLSGACENLEFNRDGTMNLWTKVVEL